MTVGQKLWYVPCRNSGGGTYVSITKVGRKWVYFKLHYREYRFDPAKPWRGGYPVNGGQYASPGTVYLDKQAYEAQSECDAVFTEFQRKLGYSPPPLVTADDVRGAARLLRISLTKETGGEQ